MLGADRLTVNIFETANGSDFQCVFGHSECGRDFSLSLFAFVCGLFVLNNVSDICVVGGIPFETYVHSVDFRNRGMCRFCGMRLTVSYYVLFQLAWKRCLRSISCVSP